jgi:hypothetical protein
MINSQILVYVSGFGNLFFVIVKCTMLDMETGKEIGFFVTGYYLSS